MQLCEGIWISIRQKEHQQTNQQEHLVLPGSLSSLLGWAPFTLIAVPWALLQEVLHQDTVPISCLLS